MRKIIITVLLICVMSTLYAQAPVLKIDGEIVSNSFVSKKAATPDEEMFMIFRFDICNESGKNMSLNIRKIIVNEVEGTQNSFCVGSNCFGPDVFEVNDISMPKDTILPMICEYMGNGLDGVTTVRYEFITTDTVFLTVNYIIGDHVGIEKMPLKIKSSIYPNPVSSISTFSCELPENIHSAVLLIYSLIGQNVKEYKLSAGENKIPINASDFKNGIYLCSVIVNGNVLSTNKIIVK